MFRLVSNVISFYLKKPCLPLSTHLDILASQSTKSIEPQRVLVYFPQSLGCLADKLSDRNIARET